MRNLKPALEVIKKWEGLRLKAYRDPVGIPTIGYGIIVYPDGTKVKMGDKCTKKQAEEWLMHEVKIKVSGIDKYLKVELNDNQYGALVSFAYNVGVGAFKKSTLLKKLNAGDLPGATNEFKRWNKAGGKVLKGLVNRRREEEALFRKPVSEDSKKPALPKVDIPAWFEPFMKIIEKIWLAVFGSLPKDPGLDSDQDDIIKKALKSDTTLKPAVIRAAMRFYNHKRIKKKDIITVADYTMHSSKKRLFQIDMNTGKVKSYLCAHGKKSDLDYDGLVDMVSNKVGSNMSSSGAAITYKTYMSKKFGYALRLDGLEKGINDNILRRAMVVHKGKYVSDAWVKKYGKVGRTLGCWGLDAKVYKEVINKAGIGSLWYTYYK